MKTEQYIKNLSVPSGVVDAILDTDTYNEVDDQYALAYMLLSPERINTVGICAAPFHIPQKSENAADGMEKSYAEIMNVLTLMGREDMKEKTYRGSLTYLPDESTPVISDAAHFIAEQAEKHTPEKPLYVIAIGAITNVASAILLNSKSMAENTVIVWLGGHAHHQTDTKEFNMLQDIAAARVVFNSGAPIVQLPCRGVVSEFRTTRYELEHWLKGKNDIADYLADYTIATAESYAAGRPWSRPIWDVTAVAWLLNDKNRFMDSYLTSIPVPQYDFRYSFDNRRSMMRYVNYIKRDNLFEDLFKKIADCRK